MENSFTEISQIGFVVRDKERIIMESDSFLIQGHNKSVSLKT